MKPRSQPAVVPNRRRGSSFRKCAVLASTLAVGMLVNASFVPDATADIYMHTDKNGVIHFSNKPTGGKGKLVAKSPKKKKSRVRPGVTPVAPSDRSLERFVRYEKTIVEAATLYQIPVELIRAVVKVESDYDPRAVSHSGAEGLMQLMPDTAMRMQINDSFNPRMNIFGGTRYLRVLANIFNGDLELTIAGYNAGEGAVMRHGGIPPYRETQEYVLKVLHYYQRYRTINDPVMASMSQ